MGGQGELLMKGAVLPALWPCLLPCSQEAPLLFCHLAELVWLISLAWGCHQSERNPSSVPASQAMLVGSAHQGTLQVLESLEKQEAKLSLSAS